MSRPLNHRHKQWWARHVILWEPRSVSASSHHWPRQPREEKKNNNKRRKLKRGMSFLGTLNGLCVGEYKLVFLSSPVSHAADAKSMKNGPPNEELSTIWNVFFLISLSLRFSSIRLVLWTAAFQRQKIDKTKNRNHLDNVNWQMDVD